MPELIVYPVGEPQRLNDIETTEWEERKASIQNRKRYYDGDHRKYLINTLTGKLSDDNVIINLTQRVIDQSISMLVGETPKFTLQNEAYQNVLDAILDVSEINILLHNAAVLGSISGHVFIKLKAQTMMNGRISGITKLINLDPELMTVFWKPGNNGDRNEVVCYKIEYTEKNVIHREDIYRQNEQSWVIQPYTKTDGSGWKTGELLVWNMSFPPIIDWQNLPNYRGYYGQSDLVNIGINDSVNFVASNINSILRNHAHPKTFGVGIEKGQIEKTAVDGFWSISNPDAKISNLEMQSDLASSMAFLEFLQGSFYSQHRAVDLASMKDRIGQLTNFGLRMLFKDALDKTRVKQTLYGEGLELLCKRAGMISGYDFGDVHINWADPLPFNDREEIEGLEKELSLGIVSKETAAEVRGRDWELEQARMQQEKANDQLGLGAALASAMRGFDRGDGNQEDVNNG